MPLRCLSLPLEARYRKLGEHTLNSQLVKSTGIAGLGGLLFGFDTAVIAGTTGALSQVYHLSPDRQTADAVGGRTGDRGDDPAAARASMGLDRDAKCR